MNSRKLINQWLGAAGGWTHSYQWRLVLTGSGSNTPTKYTVTYPDGRIVAFSNPVGTTYYPPFGVTDTFTGRSGNGYVYLVMSDGGKVRFNQTGVPNSGSYSISTETPDQIIDPNTLVTTMSYDGSNRLIEVKEPAGRKLKIYYGASGAGSGYISEVDALASDGHVSQWVKYTYQTLAFSGYNWNVLTGASYIGSPVPTAAYTYQGSNISTSVTPLIKTCQDVRYPGPMKNIQYVFMTNAPLSWGQLYQEKSLGGMLVAQLTGTTGSVRTETRGDGATRTFTYGALVGTTGDYKAYLLKSYTDFLAHPTTLTYDDNGFVNSVTDANGHKTSYERFTLHGAATKITHPTTATENPGKTIQYFYTDSTGVYLDHATDELNHTTTYQRDPASHLVTEIDYPDGGIEKFTAYNGFNQILTHVLPANTSTGSTGGTETYTYDGFGRMTKYTPPAGLPDASSLYHYDTNDHLDTITDGRGNVTTLYHNEIGQLTVIQHDDADNSLVGYGYNTDGTLANQNVQLNATTFANTVYTYDDYKRLLTVTDPMGHLTKFWYDTAGAGVADLTHTDSNVTRMVLPSGKVTKTVYDDNLRKDTVTVGYGTTDAATTNYDFDPVGNLIAVTDPKLYKTSYFYDERDRLIGVDDPIATDRNSASPPHTVSYTYDAASNKKTEQRANDQLITYDTYDNMNRLTQMTVDQGSTPDAVTKYTWTKAGEVDTMTDPGTGGSGHVYNYDYDTLNRLVTTTYPTGGGTEVRTYDAAGNVKTLKNRAGQTETFTYDSRNR
jgi:YD repeat-containing protein